MSQEMQTLVAAYSWPSQAYWRYFELNALRAIPMERPILEIGCGDGRFSSLIFDEIDEAIDINPKAVARAQTQRLYRNVHCGDARSLDQNGRFATVYANCVMEHIPGIDQVLRECWHALRPGGRLVMTVPLREMNQHLVFRSPSYTRWRQKRLAHHNLLDIEGWRRLLDDAGFTDAACNAYLGANACRFWDSVDVIGCLGWGGFCLATVTARLSRVRWRRSKSQAIAGGAIEARVAVWMEQHLSRNDDLSSACATVIVALK
jgi:SAM-dependent methyltransferase